MFPAFEKVHRLLGDFPSLEHHLEEALAEGELHSGEVDVLHGVEEAVLGEETERDQGMQVNVGMGQVAE